MIEIFSIPLIVIEVNDMLFIINRILLMKVIQKTMINNLTQRKFNF